jgi:two-component system cell cycle sensor histidine kinase/response regulator CckA
LLSSFIILKNKTIDDGQEMEQKNAFVDEEVKKEEERLIQMQKMEAMETLSNGIAHDFNNILSGIVGYSEVALMIAEKDIQVKNILGKILEACDQAKTLIDQVMSFSRQNWQAGDEAPMRLVPVIKEVIELVKASLPANIEIRGNITQDADIIYASPTMIRKVIINLCTNAIQAMKENGGTLAIELKERKVDQESAKSQNITPGPYLMLSVSDSGPGIPENIRDRIFDPYFTTKAKGEGTGLGLSVVYGVIKNNKGAVKVSSIPDKKTTFDILLPQIEITDLS